MRLPVGPLAFEPLGMNDGMIRSGDIEGWQNLSIWGLAVVFGCLMLLDDWWER